MGRGGVARLARPRRPLALALSVLLVATLAAVALVRAQPAVTPVVVALPDQHPYGVVVDSRTGHAFVTSYSDNRVGSHVAMLDATRGALLRTVALPLAPVALAVDPRAARVYVVGTTGAASDGAVSILDAGSGSVLRTITLPPLTRCVAVDERDGRVYVGSAGAGYTGSSGVVSVLDATTGRRVRTVFVGGDPWALAVDGRTRHLVIAGFRWVTGGGGSGYATTHLTTLDARSGHVIRDLSLGRVGISALAVDDHAGRAVALTNNFFGSAVALTNNFFGSSGVNLYSGTVQILDTTTGARVRSTPLTGLPTALVADVRTGRIIVTHNGPARVVTTTQTGPGGVVQGQSVSLAPTGKGRVSVLETRSGRLLRTAQVDGVPGAVALGVTPGHILVASASPSGTGGQLLGGGTITLLNEQTGVIQSVVSVAAPLTARTLAVDARTLAVDSRAGRVFTLNDGVASTAQDPWGWMPSWLRTRLPFLPAHPVRTRPVPARVTVLTVSR